MKKFIYLLLCILLFSSCKETRISELTYEFNRGEDKLYVFQNGKPFDGIVWSDNERVKIVVDCGICQDILGYYSSGEICMKASVKESLFTFYNKKGNEITLNDFKKTYPDDYKIWAKDNEVLFNKMNESLK